MVSKIKKQALSFKHRGEFGLDGDLETIDVKIWGQLMPLDRKARDMEAKWGDTLPSLVSPDLAGRFYAAYEALGKLARVKEPTPKMIVDVSKVAGQLMRAWDVLEQHALAAGHAPLPADCYCMDLDGKIVCIARNGTKGIRAQHPDWIVYTFEDAARILAASHTNTFYNDALASFPDAKITKVTANESYDAELDDEIPF